MADIGKFKVIYTKRSLDNLLEIKGYLLYHFTRKEVENLYIMFYDFEDVVKIFPESLPSNYKRQEN